MRWRLRGFIVAAAISLVGTAVLYAMIPGPDFPTAGFIYGRNGIRQAYQTGRGQIIMRARAVIDFRLKLA